jgi:hypothetical protein
MTDFYPKAIPKSGDRSSEKIALALAAAATCDLTAALADADVSPWMSVRGLSFCGGMMDVAERSPRRHEPARDGPTLR